jgi:hypothetical protein
MAPRCSAVAVGPTTLLTASHCIEGEGLPAIAYVPHGSPTAHVGRTVRRDVSRDLAWVETTTELEPAAQATAEVGELVTLERPLWGGARMGLVREQQGAFLLVGIPADHGDSGSPVFNGYGELVGLTVLCASNDATPDPIDCDPRGPSTATALTVEDATR